MRAYRFLPRFVPDENLIPDRHITSDRGLINPRAWLVSTGRFKAVEPFPLPIQVPARAGWQRPTRAQSQASGQKGGGTSCQGYQCAVLVLLLES